MIVTTAHLFGAIAQLGERLLCKQEVVGSIPSGSTRGLAGMALRAGGARALSMGDPEVLEPFAGRAEARSCGCLTS